MTSVEAFISSNIVQTNTDRLKHNFSTPSYNMSAAKLHGQNVVYYIAIHVLITKDMTRKPL